MNLHPRVIKGTFRPLRAAVMLAKSPTLTPALEVLMRRLAFALVALATISLAACTSPTGPSTRNDGVTENVGH